MVFVTEKLGFLQHFIHVLEFDYVHLRPRVLCLFWQKTSAVLLGYLIWLLAFVKDLPFPPSDFQLLLLMKYSRKLRRCNTELIHDQLDQNHGRKMVHRSHISYQGGVEKLWTRGEMGIIFTVITDCTAIHV